MIDLVYLIQNFNSRVNDKHLLQIMCTFTIKTG